MHLLSAPILLLLLQANLGAPEEPLSPLWNQKVAVALSSMREKFRLPALAGCLLTSHGCLGAAAVGVRKWGTNTPISLSDPLHLGSDTKAMTAFLVGEAIEKGLLRWDTTLSHALPQFAAIMNPAYCQVTISMLLEHRSGFSSASWPPGQTFQSLHALSGSPMHQRLAYARMVLQDPPICPPGTHYLYSNRNYALLGVILEQKTGLPWEKLIQKWLFHPLSMSTAGFGAMGTPGKLDAPWQHVWGPNGMPQPIPPGPMSDNPPAIAPAATIHCSILDWAKFVRQILAGLEGEDSLLKASTIKALLTPQSGGEYAGGWLLTQRPWALGEVYTHAGSNTMNFCVAWVAPKRDFAVLVATNIGGDEAARACDAAASALIELYLSSIKEAHSE